MVTFLALLLLQVEMRMIRFMRSKHSSFWGWLDKRPVGQRSKTEPKT